jgi:hypothetical protein
MFTNATSGSCREFAQVKRSMMFFSQKEPSPQRPLRVFLCHTEKDNPAAQDLYHTLQQYGIEPWSRAENLLPGQHDTVLTQAIHNADIFIACLSQATVMETGTWNREINQGLECAKTQPDDNIYFITARLEACELPQRLQDWQPVDLYQAGGIDKLLKSLQYRAEQVGATHPSLASPPHPMPPLPSRSPAKGGLPMQDFYLTFKNRELERGIIERYLKHDFSIQIYAPSGLGKTWLMREIQKTMTEQGWQSLWIDFANEHSSCIADKREFLLENVRQMDITPAPDPLMTEDQLLHIIGREVSKYDHVIFFLDNADRCDRRILEWIRATLLLVLSDWGKPAIVSSSQKEIPEWKGYRRGRSFHEVVLPSFNDPLVLREIVNDVAERFGEQPLKKRMQVPEWKRDMDTMIEGLRKVTREHPLAIERVLRYAIERNGLLKPQFFHDYRDELTLSCISPIIGERILPTLDHSVREAFRNLCVFRYIWGGIIRKLTKDSGFLWRPFSSSGKGWGVWWSLLQDTHLIANTDPRMLYPLSPIIRQLINQVLHYEDLEGYYLRHEFARREYEQLVGTSQAPMIQRAAALMESWYHITQEQSSTQTNKETVIQHQLTKFMDTILAESHERLEVAQQMRGWLREDSELREEIEHVSDTCYEWMIEQVEQYITQWKGRINE